MSVLDRLGELQDEARQERESLRAKRAEIDEQIKRLSRFIGPETQVSNARPAPTLRTSDRRYTNPRPATIIKVADALLSYAPEQPFTQRAARTASGCTAKALGGALFFLRERGVVAKAGRSSGRGGSPLYRVVDRSGLNEIRAYAMGEATL